MNPQITHADDEQLKRLLGRTDAPETPNETPGALWSSEERRLRAVELAIAGYEKMPQTNLLSAAAAIERYIETGAIAEQPAPSPFAARAFVDDDGSESGFKEIG